MSDIRLGNAGKININNLKAGIKKEQIQHDEKLQKLFDAVDTHKDGVLDDNEIEQFKKQILEQAGNDKLSNREANKFLKNLKMEHITKEDLFEFIETLSQEGENITESVCVSDKKGNKTTIKKQGGNKHEKENACIGISRNLCMFFCIYRSLRKRGCSGNLCNC